MKGNVVKSALGLAFAVLVAVSPSYAHSWSFHKASTNKSVDFTISSAAKLGNGALLEPGSYKLEVPEDSQSPEVAIYQNGKLVAKAPAKITSENQKLPYTEVDTDQRGNERVITQIRPSGWNEKLVFSDNGGETTKAGQ